MSTIGQTYYDSIRTLQDKDNANVRKVATNSNGDYVANEGDKKAFDVGDKEMGKDQFLKLLVAQLQHQDPMNPAEDTQFVAQLAQFSQLEFTQNSSAAISQLASNMQAFMDMQTLQAQSITNASATPLIGKSVRVMESDFDYSSTEGREFNIHLTEGYRSAKIIIRDEEGGIVAEIGVNAEDSKGGDYVAKWDGIDSETGNKILGGKYTVEVMNMLGNAPAGYAFQEGVVTGVNFNAGGASLTINGKQYGLGYLVNVEDYEKDPTKDKPKDPVTNPGGGFDDPDPDPVT
jgi:flagellar basal-body rod modification protein FlgD